MIRAVDLKDAIPGADLRGDGSVPLLGVTHDSRQVDNGFLFAVLRGANVDGRDFVDGAIKKGAVALLVDEFLDAPVTQIRLPDPRVALGDVAAKVYGDPTAELHLVGITGTNGKTTTVYLVEAALRSAGLVPGVMTTVEYRVGDKRWSAPHTTPEATVVQSTAKNILDAGATHLVLEASSHGLSLGRLGGCRFEVVAFSNLTQDHLDFHRDMEAYGQAKLKLFTDFKGTRAVVNADDPFSSTIIGAVKEPPLTVSIDPGSFADVKPESSPVFDINGITAFITYASQRFELKSPLIGPHNLSNLLLTLGICIELGLDPTVACEGLGELGVVPGRLQRVSSKDGPAVFVDYAHTPDALQRVLAALRPLTKGRLICVFGCGGDRDRTKRPIMGRAVGEQADIAMVTSDNPRTEEPKSILDMIVPGVEESGLKKVTESLGTASSGTVTIIDRKEAIETAIRFADPSDTILIAGKGHEDYQILGTEKIHFDDREVAAEALASLRRQNA